jgi:Protein of unknown function (DUF2627)
MSGQPPSVGAAKTYRRPPEQWEEPVTNLRFAGIMLLLVGGFHAINGLVSLVKDELFSIRSAQLPIELSYTVWGWVHLVFGLLLVLAGVRLVTGRGGATLGATLAGLSAAANFVFLPAAPLSSILIIGVDIAIIQVLTRKTHY